MALVIVSDGKKLGSARLRTMTMRGLFFVAGAVTMAALLGGFALGSRYGAGAAAEAAARANLDPAQPGGQALIREIAGLYGRLIRLESEAGRLAKRVDTPRPAAMVAADAKLATVVKPAGGPLVAPPFGAGTGTRASLVWLDLAFDDVETTLDRVASLVARRDLDEMAFPSRTPVPGVAISSGFGLRIDPFTRRLAQHAGFDYSAPGGTPILASAGGRVRRAGPYGAYGRTVEIDHGDGLVTRYGHISKILVKVGDLALPGQQIGTIGSTGRSTGPHLHFEVLQNGRQVQPELYLVGEGP